MPLPESRLLDFAEIPVIDIDGSITASGAEFIRTFDHA